MLSVVMNDFLLSMHGKWVCPYVSKETLRLARIQITHVAPLLPAHQHPGKEDK